jgi:hypothetical protein
MLGLIATADAAEARGDAEAALAIVESQPWDEKGRLFWRSSRIERLEQILRLGDALPRWAVSRWILEQAMQTYQPAMRSAHLRSLELAVQLRGGIEALPGVDEVDARSRVMENDWVYRQLFLYDHGALAGYLRSHASGDLVSGADQIRAWADAPMRALRFVGRAPTVLHWVDLATDEAVVVPNLGAAALVLPGECVLGRLVPSQLGDMFEGIPLLVLENVATEVARDPAAWVEVLRRRGPSEPCAHAVVRGTHLVSDVPPTAWQLAVVDYAGVPIGDETPEALVDAVLATVRAAMTGRLEEDVDDEGLDPWPCLAAAILHPLVLDRLGGSFGPDDGPGLLDLASRLVGPAADVCRELARPVRDVA